MIRIQIQEAWIPNQIAASIWLVSHTPHSVEFHQNLLVLVTLYYPAEKWTANEQT